MGVDPPSPLPNDFCMGNPDTSDFVQLDGNMTVNEKESSKMKDKITCAQYLPVVATYNCRSLFPKLDNVASD